MLQQVRLHTNFVKSTWESELQSTAQTATNVWLTWHAIDTKYCAAGPVRQNAADN